MTLLWKKWLGSGLLLAIVCLIGYYLANPPKVDGPISDMGSQMLNFNAAGDSLPNAENFPYNLSCPQQVSAISFEGELDFAGEKVPFEDFDVKERLERELLINTFWHSSTIYTFKLSGRYFHQIEQVLAANGVPDDFKYLAMAESGLRNQISPANAVGIWQILKKTGQEYGLEVNDEVDERYDLVRSTEAACKYLNKAYDRFGSWTLAAASYNMGMRGLDRDIENQSVTNYYDLYLNSETSRYVFRILALKEIYNNPEKYGFYFDEADFYEPLAYQSVAVDSTISDLATFAKQQGTTYKMVKLMNPWMRTNRLTNSANKPYSIKLPELKNDNHINN